MFRLNIEDSIWSDHRFQRFMLLVGDRHKAIGILVDLWVIAQRFWIPNRCLIPEQEWQNANLPETLLEVGLAERKADGIYAKGAEEKFSWYLDGIQQRREAGRNSAKRPRDENGRFLSNNEPKPTETSEVQRSLDRDPTETNELQPSSSFSSSKRKRVVGPSNATVLWSYYTVKISSKGLEAVHEGAKTNTLCNSLANKYGLNKAKELVDAYFRDETPWVREKAWPLGLLVSQQQTYLNKIQTQAPEQKHTLDFGNEWG